MNAEDIVKVVAPLWDQEVKPLLEPAACIAACRTLAEVFDYFKIDYAVVPVSVVVANDLGFESMGRVHPDEFPTAAWTIGVDPSSSHGGWGGHLVVITADEPRLYIDLDARQFDRFPQRIETGGPVIAPYDDFELVKRSEEGLEQFGFGMLHKPLVQGHYLWVPNLNNETFLDAKDWINPYDSVIGEAIRRCKGRTPRTLSRVR